MASEEVPSLSQDVIRGAKWYVMMRWSIRGLGFVSSAVLARLLVPEDFGLVAMVLVIFGLVSLLFEFGVNWALIQNNKATDDHFHTAWTVRVLQSCAVAGVLAACAPLIASSYDDARLENICWIMALGVFIRGFENIGVIKFQKDMKFAQDFAYSVAPKVISTFVTIGLAFYFRSYMALVMGTLLNSFTVVCASYIAIRFKPKFSFAKISEIWGFSQWVLVSNVAKYIGTRGDVMLLSLFSTPTNIGYYKWGTELSYMTMTEIQQPFSRALMPGLAKIKDDHNRLIAAFLKALSMMAVVAVPVALGFGAVSEELIPLFLGGGDKWLPVVPLVEALVFLSMSSALYGISGSLLLITGNVKYTAYISWVQAAVMLVSLYPAYYFAGMEGVAYSRGGLGIVMFFVVSLLATNRCNFRLQSILSVVWRPVAAGIGMFVLLTSLSDVWVLDIWMLLGVKIVIGVIFYVVALLLLWGLAGRPDTAEHQILGYIRTKLKKSSKTYKA